MTALLKKWRTLRPAFMLAAGVLLASAASAQETSLSGFSAPKDQLERDQLTGLAKRFEGTALIFDQSTTPDTLFRGSQLSPVPSYQWFLSFRPRYNFNESWSIRARVDMNLEWLNAAETTLARQPILDDVWTDIAFKPPEFAGIESVFRLRAIWGTSIASISAGEVADVGPVAAFVRDFHLGRGQEIELSLAGYALYHFDKSNTPGTQQSYVCTTTDFDPIDCAQNSGQTNTQWSLTTFLGLRYNPVKHLSFGVSYSMIDAWGYDITGGTLQTQTGSSLALETSPTDTRQRSSGWFLASVDYEVQKWFSLGLGYYCLRPVLDPDSKYGDPFYSPGNTRIFLTSTFNLDWAYQQLFER